MILYFFLVYFGIITFGLVYSGWNQETIWHIISALVFGLLPLVFSTSSFKRRRILEILIVFLVTLFFIIWIPAKEVTSREIPFTTFILRDEKFKSYYSPLGHERFQRYQWLGICEMSNVKVCDTPTNEQEIHALNVKLIEYVLLEKMPDYTEPITFSYTENREVKAITIGAFPFTQIDISSYSKKKWFDRILSSKIFGVHPTEEQRLRFAPPDEVYSFPSSVSIMSTTTVNKYNSFEGIKIVLKDVGYFTATISVLPIGSTTGFPHGLDFYFPQERERAENVRTYIYRVEMDARFNRLTSNSNLSREYQDWVKNLFYRIRTIFSDESRPEDVRDLYL